MRKKLFTLAAAVLASISLWAAETVTFSATELSEQSSGVTKGKITAFCPTKAGEQQWYKNSSTIKGNAISLGSSADTAVIVPQSGKSIQFRAIDGRVITGISIEAAASKDSVCGEPIVIWTGEVNKFPAYVGNIEVPARNGTEKPAAVEVTSIPSGTNAFALYRRIKYNSSTGEIGAGNNYGRSQQTWNIFNVTITYEVACNAPSISTQPTGATLEIGEDNPELSVVATNTTSYAWKESSDGTAFDGEEVLATTATFTPEVNDAAQTKYYYCELVNSCNEGNIIKTNIVTVNVVAEIVNYTITLNPAGGATDAEGWELADDKYTKSFASGTEVVLPELTKANRSFKEWRNTAEVAVESPLTITKDTVLTAVWTKTIDQVIYSWEGAEGGATEVGGTASGEGLVNVASAGYYCLKIDGKADWSTNKVEITLAGDEKVKTGDKITYWGFYSKDSNKSARPKMRDGNSPNAAIFDDPTDLPNLYSGGDPAVRNFTVPASINTNKVQITRSQTGSNTWISKLQIVRQVAVEEANIATITFDADGGSEVVALEVVKGQPASKPADPTKDGFVFAGWFNGAVAYNWSDAVTGDLTLTAHWNELFAVTYDAGEGAGNMEGETHVAGDVVTLPECTFVAPNGKEFDAWTSDDVEIADGKFTMPAQDVTVTATWKTELSRFKVAYYDGENKLGEEQVLVGEHPVATGISIPTKEFRQFASWQQDAVDIELDAVEGQKDDSLTLFTRYDKVYSQSINIEQLIMDNSTKFAIADTLRASSIAAVDIDALDSLNNSKTKRNYPFLGLKIKKATSSISVLLASGSTLRVKFGNVGANVNVKVGDADPVAKTADVLANPYEYTNNTEGDVIVRFLSTDTKTVVFQQIMIDEDIEEITLPALYTVTFDATPGSCEVASVSTQFAGDKVELPEVTPVDNYRFNGWFNASAEGSKIGVAGDKWAPTSDTILYAQFSELFTIDIDDETEHGNITCDKEFAAAGETVTITITPEDNYELNELTVTSLEAEDITINGNEATFVMPGQAVEVNASFKQITYTITYNAGTGTCVKASDEVAKGTSVVLPEATRDGYTFDGWFTAAEEGELIGKAGDEYTPAASITLFAQYSADEPAGCNWASLSWIPTAALPQYDNQFKICVGDPAPGVVNIQNPFGTGNGIYITFPTDLFGTISLDAAAYKTQGAGMLLYVEAFTDQETEVVVQCKKTGADPDYTNFVFTIYNDKGTATAIDNANANAKAVKRIVNGQLVIEFNGRSYNILGAELK